MTKNGIENKLELLAPVGSFEGLRAAVANGADAIYVGGPSFGARVEAAFDHEKLVEVIEFCHLYDVRAYVTINTTLFDDELNTLENYIHFLYTNGADAVIVSDLGVAKLARELYSDLEIHISTQAHTHNVSAVQFFKEFGANRIVAARENNLAEIKAMSAVGIEVEVFVHGALCFSYSGQCLMSSMFGGRSGNRGACAQPCRLNYELVNLETGVTLENEAGNYLLSPRDLNTVNEIGQLIEAGATSFKIEGRLKKPEYVAAVVKAYRMAIDNYLATEKIDLDEKLIADMKQVFSRTFTKGFLHGDSGRTWLGADRPGHRGILIGKVTGVKGNRATVKLTDELHLHDGVRFVGNEEFGMQVQKLFVNFEDVPSVLRGEVDLICNFSPVLGMEVYKTASKKLADELAVDKMPRIMINGKITVEPGKPLTLTVSDELGNVANAESAEFVQIAEGEGLTKARIGQQISKTGSTPFAFSQLEIDIKAPGMLPISALNQLRRTALEELETKRRNPYVTRTFSESEFAPTLPLALTVQSELAVSVRNLEQLRAVCNHDEIKIIYYQHFPTLTQAVVMAASIGKVLIPQIPRVVDDHFIATMKEKLKSLVIKTVLVGEYGTFQALKDEFTIITDYSFNANNGLTLASLAKLGIAGSTLSHEITGSKIRKLAKNTPVPLEVVVFTKTPLMITKHCPLKMHYQSAGGPCRGKYCQVNHGLRDRKGELLPIVRSGKCNIEILSNQYLNLSERLDELSNAGITRFRLEFTTETPTEINNVIQAFISADQSKLANQKSTLGHYNRGV